MTLLGLSWAAAEARTGPQRVVVVAAGEVVPGAYTAFEQLCEAGVPEREEERQVEELRAVAGSPALAEGRGARLRHWSLARLVACGMGQESRKTDPAGMAWVALPQGPLARILIRDD